MTLLQKLSLAVTIGSTTLSVAASIPNPKNILPDNVVLCEPDAGCINQTLFGREYKVLSTPRFTVMVSISHQGPYTRADVSITNNTGTPLSLTPEDFRVEVITPKPKVLLYVPPANLVLPPPPLPPAPPAAPAPQSTPQIGSAFVSQSSAPSATDTADNPTPPTTEIDPVAAAEKEKALQEAADKAAADKDLPATSIAPNEVTRGRVYFERDKKSHLVNVVLPIAGLVFEFPYAMKH
jgi:hypothetical protein